MGCLIYRKQDITDQEAERRSRFVKLSTEEKVNELFALIQLSVQLNNNQPIKLPAGKGIVLKKISNGYSE